VKLQLNVDCADLERMTGFYIAALGYRSVGAAAQYVSLVPVDGSGPKIIFQRVAEPKVVKNRMHLDLIVDDIEAEAARFVTLGATRGESFAELGVHWIVMQDPEGNEICLCDA
jgi:predicted enzyme related to lactoylglutathione lyase